MVEEIPRALIEHISSSDRRIVERWWANLADTERRLVVESCDVGHEERFFGPAPAGEEHPLVVGGKFLPHDDAWRLESWADGWREYLAEHEELFLAAQFVSWRLEVGSGPCGESGYQVSCWADWGRTLFRNDELPPSQRLEEYGAAPAPNVIRVRVHRL